MPDCQCRPLRSAVVFAAALWTVGSAGFKFVRMSDFEDAVGNYLGEAVDAFDAAYTEYQAGLPSPIPPLPAPLPEAEQKKLDAAKAKLSAAQARMSVAIKQLVFASQTLSDEDRRVGFKAVVKLMSATADTAQVVCTRLQSEFGPGQLQPSTDTEQPQRVAMLVSALQALANLSPIAVWQEDPETPA